MSNKQFLIVLVATLSFFANIQHILGIPEPIGRMVDVGGYKLHLYEMSKGTPAVILDACLGANVLEWSLVQPRVAHFAHVCSYDRAGLGWSEKSNLARKSSCMVEELRLLLRNAGIKPPYILVGCSSGGVTMRLFTNTYPNEVFGLILVDSSHEEQLGALQTLQQKFTPPAVQGVYGVAWLPTALQGMYTELMNNPKERSTGAEEKKSLSEGYEEAKKSTNALVNKPLIVISRGTKVLDNAIPERTPYEAAWHEQWMLFQQELVSRSSKSKHIIAHGCGHMIQRERPEIIVEAIREMIEAYAAQ